MLYMHIQRVNQFAGIHLFARSMFWKYMYIIKTRGFFSISPPPPHFWVKLYITIAYSFFVKISDKRYMYPHPNPFNFLPTRLQLKSINVFRKKYTLYTSIYNSIHWDTMFRNENEEQARSGSEVYFFTIYSFDFLIRVLWVTSPTSVL